MVDIRLRLRCVIPPTSYTADNRLAQRLQLSFGRIMCTPLHGPVQFAYIHRGVRLAGHTFSQKNVNSGNVSPCFSGQAHSSSQTASRSVQPFLYGSQMICCAMHCHWGRNPQNCPFPLRFRHPTGGGPIHGHRQHAPKIW